MSKTNTLKSQSLYQRAIKVMPGGVNSPVRAFKAVEGNPVFIKRGQDSHIWDVDGNEYIDTVCSWGPLILGHARKEVVEVLQYVATQGTSFGAPTEYEVELAEFITRIVPSIEMVRMVNSGTEATMSAIRLARGYTGRPKIIKFEGCYHGHGDSFLSKAGSGALTFGIPDSFGVTPDNAKDTLNAIYNNIVSVENLIQEYNNQIAAIIVEPVAANIGCVLPVDGFLQSLRELCTNHSILLIFDEVITGFRVALGGAQEKFGVKPDLTTLGKIIGGGLPVGAYGGKLEIMKYVAPLGGVYQAGTLSGNPIAMAAGLTTLKILKNENVYEDLEKKGQLLKNGLKEIVEFLGVPVTFNRIGSIFCSYFTSGPVVDYNSVKMSDVSRFNKYFWEMLRQGVYIAPSQFEAGFLSTAHSYEDIEYILRSVRKALETAFD